MDFRFGNLLGAPYRGGSVVFDGAAILSPVGNRIQSIDLARSQTRTLPIECLQQIRVACLSPCGRLLLLFDVEGRLVVVNKTRESVLHHMKFKSPVRCAKFSPDGELVAVGCGTRLQVWKRPAMEKKLAPMCLYRSYNAVAESITCLDWTLDGFGIAIGARDMTTRIFTIDPVRDYRPGVLGGHRGSIVGVLFTTEKTKRRSEIANDVKDRPVDLITIGAMGKISEWSYDRVDNPRDESLSDADHKRPREGSSKNEIDGDAEMHVTESQSSAPAYLRASNVTSTQNLKSAVREDWIFHGGKWLRCFYHSFDLKGRTVVSDVDYHRETGLMVVGFSNGVFELVQFPGFHRRQVLSVSQERLTAVRLSPQADWIAVGCAKLGQLLVWDWRSETQVLKQQGHTFDVSSIAFSPDGSLLATGAEDTKVKVFSMATGFCTVTFKEHLMPVTAVQFLPNGNAVLSASLDGTVRAFDLVRYRNFRSFTSPDPVQFSCLAVDPKGEFVAAGSHDSFQIFVWSIKTSKLLDILAAHEGPVSALSFHPVQPVLGSSSWDQSVKLWDVFGTSKGSIETLIHTHDVTTFAFRMDGKQLATATLEGSLHFWDPLEGEELGVIEGRRDIARGRFVTDRRVATPFSTEAFFTSLVYSADGALLFAAGKSKYICQYDVENRVLLQKIQTSRNKSLDGVLDILNSRNLTEAGAAEMIEDEDSEEEEQDLMPPLIGAEEEEDLPGSIQRKKPVIQTRSLSLCPTGQRFAAATTEGVLVYGLDRGKLFDPLDLEEEITPQAVEESLNKAQYLTALVISLRLRETSLVQRCLLSTPVEQISVLARQLPSGYASQMLEALTLTVRASPDLELLLIWTKACCTAFGSSLAKSTPETAVSLKKLHQVLHSFQSELGTLVQSNLYLMQYINTAHHKTANPEHMPLDQDPSDL